MVYPPQYIVNRKYRPNKVNRTIRGPNRYDNVYRLKEEKYQLWGNIYVYGV